MLDKLFEGLSKNIVLIIIGAIVGIAIAVIAIIYAPVIIYE
jgi:capsular polysaccharide biosynthesis protein